MIRGTIIAATVLAITTAISAASASAEPASCPNASLRTGLSAHLPDCRAYEQVSPIEKDGGSGGVSGGSPAGLSLANGEAVTYEGEPFFNAHGPLGEAYTSRRSPTGWSTENGDTLSPETVPAPILPPSVPAGGALILEETTNGDKVFFLDEEPELIPGVSNPAPNEPDLYEYEIPTTKHPNGQLTDLTINKPEHPDVQGILGIGGEGNEEGSYVYFVAGGKLTPNAPTGTCGETGGKRESGVGHQDGATGTGCKLYLRHNGTTTFIATFEPKDESGLNGVDVSVKSNYVFDWSVVASERTAEVSPNGRYVAFGSRKELTGQAAEPYAVEGENGEGVKEVIPGAEIFLYSVEAEESHEQSMVCVSCDPGAVAKNSVLPPASGAINGASRSRYMLDDGNVLFTTSAALVPQDINHQPDLYEWESPGVGDCSLSSERFSAPSGGCVALISGGTSETSPDVVFADASTTGSDIFFVTSQSLLPQDQDEIKDMYDARENGGLPPPPPQTCPTNTSCPNTSATPPTLISPTGSATFFGTEAPPAITTVKKPTVSKPLPRAQQLTKALRTCHAKRSRKKRAACEATARKRYGPIHRPKKVARRTTR